ncbi:MAG: hypothetical protein Q8922_04685 [Bacteroidota bacterium]|nr:hypothetical protein [Bacteroidota bacterium]MDP4231878.1 hypothetical protein [Bacteroidota bacterium]MDP4242764.1 hypothetical protein [Bacteroidota bacterium]MDP4287215.1 hypothetical protein [Bacteroidota bacterium]
MIPLYLRYRNSASDPWSTVPSLTGAFPGLAAGSMPISSTTLETAPQAVTPCGCPGASTEDSYLILRANCAPIPLASEASLLTFLMLYKTATYHEAKFTRYGQGGYVSASVSLIEAHEQNGMLQLCFRLAAAISDALTNT